MRYFAYNMMYYRISKNDKNLFFLKKNRPGVGSDLKHAKIIFLSVAFLYSLSIYSYFLI